MADAEIDLSIVILSWNTRDLLDECLVAVRAGLGNLRAETIVIDNASADGSADMVAERHPWARLIRNAENTGYARGVNQGLRESHGRRVALLGSDTRVAPDALPKLCAFLDAHPECGMVAPRLVNADRSTQRACMRFPTLATAFFWDTPLGALFPKGRELSRYQYLDWDHRGSRIVEQPPGTCCVVPRAVIDEIGPMDERLWLFFNDVDWSLRMTAAGHVLWYLDDAEVFHHQGASTKKFNDFGPEWHRNRIAFYRKHHGLVGAFLTKTVLVYVALRQCVRVRRDVGSWRAAKPHCAVIMKTLRDILAHH